MAYIEDQVYTNLFMDLVNNGLGFVTLKGTSKAKWVEAAEHRWSYPRLKKLIEIAEQHGFDVACEPGFVDETPGDRLLVKFAFTARDPNRL